MSLHQAARGSFAMAEDSGRRSVHILMLEDSALDAELAIARLRKADFDPEVTLVQDRQSFEQAVEQSHERSSERSAGRSSESRGPSQPPFQLILADYALPDFDGISALALARERLPTVPFIFISGRVGEEVAIDTLQRGATDYVLKHRLERLVPAVLRALKESDEHSTRMQAEANFRESEQRFHHVIDAVAQMIWISDNQGNLIYSNYAWREHTANSANNWCDPGLFEPDDYDACMKSWRVALERSEPFTIEVRLFRRSDSTYRWHLLRIAPLAPDPDAGHDPYRAAQGSSPLQWLGTATDLQDQKLNEEALRTAEKLSVTGRMAAAIAHEINNPLESLTNLLFLVRLESEGSPRALSFLDIADSELERISSITKQTLQFYRDPATPVDVDARQMLEEVLRLFSTRLTSKTIAISLDARPGLVFQAIKGEIRQVLINLVNNAIDAVGEHGSIDIEACEGEHQTQPAVEIGVHDNGSGITPDQAVRLFQPFFSTKGALGTGLGLWVSKGIVEKHGGTLRLGSSKSNGRSRTTATIVLPLRAAPELLQRRKTTVTG